MRRGAPQGAPRRCRPAAQGTRGRRRRGNPWREPPSSHLQPRSRSRRARALVRVGARRARASSWLRRGSFAPPSRRRTERRGSSRTSTSTRSSGRSLAHGELADPRSGRTLPGVARADPRRSAVEARRRRHRPRLPARAEHARARRLARRRSRLPDRASTRALDRAGAWRAPPSRVLLPAGILSTYVMADAVAWPLALGAVAAGLAALDRPGWKPQLLFLVARRSGDRSPRSVRRAPARVRRGRPRARALLASAAPCASTCAWSRRRSAAAVLVALAAGPGRVLGYYRGVLDLDLSPLGDRPLAGRRLLPPRLRFGRRTRAGRRRSASSSRRYDLGAGPSMRSLSSRG